MATQTPYSHEKNCIQILLILTAALSLPAAIPDSGRGSISGVVTNKATGDLLRDATVEIPEAGRTLLTDELGRFLVRDLPFGTYSVRASYLALDSDTQTVTLSQESSSASLKFPLGSEVYQLQTFVVSGEREGTAAALTRQKTSDNIKSVVSMDAMGQLASENPGELLSQMAGIAGEVDDSGEVTTISIRGINSALSSVTYDGAQVAPLSG